jgi:hypothetical protein
MQALVFWDDWYTGLRAQREKENKALRVLGTEGNRAKSTKRKREQGFAGFGHRGQQG